MSNPFLDDARAVKEEIIQKDAEKISDITLKNIDISLLFPKEEDRVYTPLQSDQLFRSMTTT